jgi:hypothetical protein
MNARVMIEIKDEFFLDQTFFSKKNSLKQQLKVLSKFIIAKVHLSLGYKTPNSVYKK